MENTLTDLKAMTTPELFNYWQSHIAIEYHNGKFLQQATLKHQKFVFNRWRLQYNL